MPLCYNSTKTHCDFVKIATLTVERMCSHQRIGFICAVTVLIVSLKLNKTAPCITSQNNMFTNYPLLKSIRQLCTKNETETVGYLGYFCGKHMIEAT